MFAAMPRSLHAGLLSAVLLLILPAAAFADTLTVDPADSNNACTRGTDNTCKTIGQAVGTAQAADTISIKKGTYPENVAIPSSLTDLKIVGGTDVKIAPASGDALTINATGVDVKSIAIETAAKAVVVADPASATITGLIAARPAASTAGDPLIDVPG